MYFSNPTHRQFMQTLDTYYGGPILEKMRSVDGTSIYVCKIDSLLLKDQQYLIAIVPEDGAPLRTKAPLRELQWTCFQARNLEGEHEYQFAVRHAYVRKTEPHVMMVQTSSNKEYTTYEDVDRRLPIELILLHTTQDGLEYPSRGSFVSCLETFQTILRWKP